MRRMYNSVSPETSIDPDSGRGASDEQRSDNGLNSDRKTINMVRRGDVINRAPLTETRDNLIGTSAVNVEARSGNDSTYMSSEDDLAFDTIADAPDVVAKPSTGMWLAAAAAIGALVWFGKRR